MQNTLIPMPSRIMPMLAKANPYGDDIWNMDLSEYGIERKFDGTRIMAIKNEYGVFLMSARSWKQDFSSRYPEIVAEIADLDCTSCILDGELTFFDYCNDVFYPASITRETMIDKDLEVRYIVFDVLEWDGESTCDLGLLERRAYLEDEIIQTPNLWITRMKMCESFNPRAWFDYITLDDGGEGVVLKRLDSKYEQNSRSRDWIKVKRVETDDYYLLGTTEGTGKREGVFGALILGRLDDVGNITGVVKCGTGFTDQQLVDIDAMVSSLPSCNPQFSTVGLDIRRVVVPTKVVEVKFMEQSKNTIRHPVFVRFREDKE